MAPETIEWLEAWLAGVPPANAWLGTTVEDEERATERIPHLVAVPAAVRFLSMEPLLERIELRRHELAGVHWVIVGGESGKKARVFEPSWAIDVVAAARASGVAPFVKQMGSRPLGMELGDAHGGDVTEWPLELRVREFPRASALPVEGAGRDDRARPWGRCVTATTAAAVCGGSVKGRRSGQAAWVTTVSTVLDHRLLAKQLGEVLTHDLAGRAPTAT